MKLEKCVRQVFIEGLVELLLCEVCDRLFVEDEMMVDVDSQPANYYCEHCAKLLTKHSAESTHETE